MIYINLYLHNIRSFKITYRLVLAPQHRQTLEKRGQPWQLWTKVPSGSERWTRVTWVARSLSWWSTRAQSRDIPETPLILLEARAPPRDFFENRRCRIAKHYHLLVQTWTIEIPFWNTFLHPFLKWLRVSDTSVQTEPRWTTYQWIVLIVQSIIPTASKITPNIIFPDFAKTLFITYSPIFRLLCLSIKNFNNHL